MTDHRIEPREMTPEQAIRFIADQWIRGVLSGDLSVDDAVKYWADMVLKARSLESREISEIVDELKRRGWTFQQTGTAIFDSDGALISEVLTETILSAPSGRETKGDDGRQDTTETRTPR